MQKINIQTKKKLQYLFVPDIGIYLYAKNLNSNLEAILILMNLAWHFNEFLFCLVWKDITIAFSVFAIRLFLWNHNCSFSITFHFYKACSLFAVFNMFTSSVIGHLTVSGFLKLWVGIMSAITENNVAWYWYSHRSLMLLTA